jgi:tRNA threonylcarbamoyladenosine biosynthesis protein TsaE
MTQMVYGIDELNEAADWLISQAKGYHIWCFYGEMGSGKTTLINALAKRMGVADAISSPTFSLVNEYHAPLNKIYHFDFYRIKDISEAYDMGYEDYFYSGALCWIEWPEKIERILEGETYFSIQIKLSENKRLLEVGMMEK